MENIVPTNQRAIWKYNNAGNIASGVEKVYHFDFVSKRPFRVYWAYISQNGLLGEANWELKEGNLKMDGVAVTGDGYYVDIPDFVNVLDPLNARIVDYPPEVQTTFEFNVKIKNTDALQRNSDMTLWIVLISYDNAVITASVTIT